MGTATPAPNRSASIITSSPFTLTDRLRIQQQHIRQCAYTKIGKLTCVVWEGQKDTRGLSQENDLGRGMMAGFGQFKRKLWSGCTLDWLNHVNAPILAVSKDRNDLLLPFKLNALPDIPDPRWKGFSVAPAHDCKNPDIPRIPQLFAGCPVVGDRACGTIKDRITGKTYLIFQPLLELQVMCGGGKESGFGRIRWMTDPATHLHGALLVEIHPDSEGKYEAYFVGGSFIAG
jgi:hypothetical protein